MKRLDQTVVVVTGASSGNGAAIARLFAQRGAILVLAARGREGLEKIESECKALGAVTLSVPTDTGQEEQVTELARKAVEAFGRIDTWVNCAAVLAFGRIEDVPAADLERVIRTNLFGYVCGTRAAIRQFRQQGHGVLINISSVLGTVGSPWTAVYSATKFGIRGLSESVRGEVRGEPDIHVCTVLPAAMDTPIFRNAANFYGLQPRAPEPLYSPDRVAAAVVALARKPRRETVVGGFGYLPRLAHALFPSLAERGTTAYIATRQFEHDHRVPDTHGNVLEPTPTSELGRGGSAPLLWDKLERPLAQCALLAGLAAAVYYLRRR